MEKRIRHEGVVESVGPHAVKVRIMQTSACAACQAASFCHASESKEKMVDVFTSSASSFEKGDSVVVWATAAVASRALLWAFAIPFVLMVTVLIVLMETIGHEGIAAVASLLSLLPYYGVLYLLRHRMRRQLTFGIEKH